MGFAVEGGFVVVIVIFCYVSWYLVYFFADVRLLGVYGVWCLGSALLVFWILHNVYVGFWFMRVGGLVVCVSDFVGLGIWLVF